MIPTSEELLKNSGRSGNGIHIFKMCFMCGDTEWERTDPSDKCVAKLELPKLGQMSFNDSTYLCYRCGEIKQRYPEVFEWICQVLTQHLSRHHRT